KAGKVQSNRKNLELIADSYLAAREVEQALAVYERAANEADDGRVAAKQGQLYLDQENWKKAESVLREALSKGKVSSPEQLYLGMGIAQFNLQNYDGAIQSFTKAQQEKEDFRAARQWISMVESARQSIDTSL